MLYLGLFYQKTKTINLILYSKFELNFCKEASLSAIASPIRLCYIYDENGWASGSWQWRSRCPLLQIPFDWARIEWRWGRRATTWGQGLTTCGSTVERRTSWHLGNIPCEPRQGPLLHGQSRAIVWGLAGRHHSFSLNVVAFEAAIFIGVWNIIS